MKKILLILSLFFVIFSFTPSLYELYHAKDLSRERMFVLEHNYMFDYNFYLSRIRQGQEGRWLTVEKYYNTPHVGSLFQIVYLYLGKIGGMFNMSPPAVYHLARILMGLTLFILIGRYVLQLFPGWWGMISFFLIVSSGSWPILVKAGNSWRFATHMGWWSAIDSLQRITFIPHVLLGQIFLLVFIWRLGNKSLKELKLFKLTMWGIIGFIAGIIFPPTLIVVYTVFGVLSVMELVQSKSSAFANLRFAEGFGKARASAFGSTESVFGQTKSADKPKLLKKWLGEKIIPRVVFVAFSFPSIVYLSLMFKVMPWSALALFDVQHRIILPYREYAMALGPVLPLGIVGLILATFQKEKKFMVPIVWILSIGLLFLVFEKVPQQSPSRFTEALAHVPLGIMATYLFYTIWNLFENKASRVITGLTVFAIVVIGLGVMGSMVLWLTDQAYAKRVGTWQVPIGAELAYPLKDFMDGVFYLRDHTPKESAVLGYITAGNFIPAYAGNYVYIGHANTPDEDGKEKIAAKFFAGKMTKEEARNFLANERISYVYFGIQEKELGGIKDLVSIYPFLSPLYQNTSVVVYKFE